MKLGINIPNLGSAAGPDGIVKVAEKAEELGFATIWSTERLLWPIDSPTGYGGMPGVPLPENYKVQLDPLDVLSYAAAVTKNVRLGTSIINLPFYNPALLARRITTLDVLSGGRAMIGMGMGWSPEEFEAAGMPMKTRGQRADEALDILHAIWKDDPVEFNGRHWRIAKSIIMPKPVQKPHPPIYMAAYTPAAMKRVAERADGWIPVGIPVPGMQAMWEQIKSMARDAGRNSEDLKLIVRANVAVTPESQGEGRFIFVGSEDEVKADIRAVKEMGADEIEFDPTTGPWGTSVEGFLECAEKMREWAG